MRSRRIAAVCGVLAGLIGAGVCSAAPAGKPAGLLLDKTGSTVAAPRVVVARDGCVTAECHPGIKASPQLHGPVRAGACDACHKLADASLHRFTPVAGRHEVCGLCHGPEATTNQFSHLPYAKGECLACHNPHGGNEPQLLRGGKYADTCAACHKDVTGAHDNVHGPASIGACGACHEPHTSKRAKLLNAQGRELCLKCHVQTGLELETRRVVHAPVLGDCQVCHNPHATDSRAMLVADTAALCTSCHQNIAGTMAAATTQHAAVTTKRSCTNCHAAHASDHESLLKSEPRQLCFECHNQPIRMPDGTELVNMKAVIETGTSLHGALTQRGCVECHDIHGGGHKRLLMLEYPSELYYPFSETSYALCFSCHDRQLVMEAKTGSATGFRNGETNLHWVHVSRDVKGRSCKVCHDSHASTHDKHIRDEVAYGPAGWKLPIRYEALPEGGKCGGSCHAAHEYNRVKPLTYEVRQPGKVWKGDELVPGSRAEPAKPK